MVARTDPPEAGSISAIRTAVERAVGAVDESLPQAELIDRIAELESLQNTVAALQAATVRAFARAHAASETASGQVEPERLERSIAHQVGLACRVSTTEGRKRIGMARDLYDGLDHVRGLFTAGILSAFKVRVIVMATTHLNATERTEVDRLLAERHIRHLGVGRSGTSPAPLPRRWRRRSTWPAAPPPAEAAASHSGRPPTA